MLESMKKLEIPGYTECPNCGCATGECPDCNKTYDYCQECGEKLVLPETYIVFTKDRYRGLDKSSQDTATLMVDGVKYAAIHINLDESQQEGGDIAYMFLSSSATWQKESEKSLITAKILAAFASWARFQWETFDKINELPTLVRLSGTTVYNDMPISHPSYFGHFVALQNATKIGVEHLELRVTWVNATMDEGGLVFGDRVVYGDQAGEVVHIVSLTEVQVRLDDDSLIVCEKKDLERECA